MPTKTTERRCSKRLKLRLADNDIGLGWAQRRAQAAMAQLGAYDFAVRPAGTASKVLNVIFCHVASLEQ